MSFPPLNNTSDYDVYTTKYLQSLALQIQLNQNNFDKNVGFMKTGVQDTERPDSRSIEERAGDVEKLKVQARVMLNKISDATNTTEVLDYLAKNGELLFFFIQQFPAIEKLVKEQYVGGVRAPILTSLIYKRFIAQQEDSLMPESADFDIVSKMMTSEDADVLVRQTRNPELKRQLQNLSSVLPSQQEIKRLIDDPVGNKDEIKFVAEMFKNSPNINNYNKLTEEYNDAPLKDDSTNYDLEQAEDMMNELITSFLVERKSFQEDKYNQRTMRQIDKTNAKRKTKALPVATDTRLIPTSEQQRATTKGRRQTVEDIKASKFALYPATTNVSELSPAEQLKVEREAMNRSKMIKDISEPRPIFSTTDLLKPTRTRKSKTLTQRVREEEQQQAIEEQQQSIGDFKQSQRNPITSKYKRQPTQREKDQKDADLEEATQRFEMGKMGKSDTKASERKQEAKQQEERELKRIINEMEQLKREKKKEEEKQKEIEEEIREKEDNLDKIKAFQEKLARRKISTFVNKQFAKSERERTQIENQIEEDLIELEQQDDSVISKKESIQAKQEELRTVKLKGKPKGTKNRPKEVIEKEKAEKAEKQQAKLENRLLGVQLPTPIGYTVPQKKKSEKVPVPTGKGLLNKQEQLSHRFKVLKGEILAGNTASQVIKEMRSLVKQLVSSQELSIDQANGILKELKTL